MILCRKRFARPGTSAGGSPVRPARRLSGGRTGTAPGFTLVEVLIAMVIMALLLAAIALATKAAMHGYTENAKIAEVTQTSRVVLHRIMREIRTADAVASDPQAVSIIPPENEEALSKIEYALENGTLYSRRTVAGSEESIELISSEGSVQVQDFSISRETDIDEEGLSYTKSVTARLELRVGENTFHVTASACPRRNLEF